MMSWKSATNQQLSPLHGLLYRSSWRTILFSSQLHPKSRLKWSQGAHDHSPGTPRQLYITTLYYKRHGHWLIKPLIKIPLLALTIYSILLLLVTRLKTPIQKPILLVHAMDTSSPATTVWSYLRPYPLSLTYSFLDMVILSAISLAKVVVLTLGTLCPIATGVLYLVGAAPFLYWALSTRYPEDMSGGLPKWIYSRPGHDINISEQSGQKIKQIFFSRKVIHKKRLVSPSGAIF